MQKSLTTDELFTAYHLALGNPPNEEWSSQKTQHYYIEFLALVKLTVHSTGLPQEIITRNSEAMQVLFSRFVKWIRDHQKAAA